MAEDQERAVFDLSTSPSHLLHRAQQFAANQSAEVLAGQGLTLRQFAVLAALAEAEGASQAYLVEQTGIDRSTLADMVSRMEKSGLVKRVPSPDDARAKAVSLTESGRAALDAAAPQVAIADQTIMKLLQSSRRPGFIASLGILADIETGIDDGDDQKGKKGKKAKKADKDDKSSKKKKKKKKK